MRVKGLPLLAVLLAAAFALMGAAQVRMLIYRDPGFQGDWSGPAGQVEGEPVPYWHEGTNYTWVRVDLSPGTNVLYVYYGSEDAPDESDGEAVFEFFDGFDLDKGYQNIGEGTGSYSVSDGILCMRELTTYNISGFEYTLLLGDFPLNQYPPGSLVVEGRVKVVRRGEYHAFLFRSVTDSDLPYNAYKFDGTQSLNPEHGIYGADVPYAGSGNWELVGAVIDDFSDGNFIAVAIDDDSSTGAEHCLDFVRIRKRASPSVSVSYGPEEPGSFSLDGHAFSKRRKVEIFSDTSLAGYQLPLDYSRWGEPNIKILRQGGGP